MPKVLFEPEGEATIEVDALEDMTLMEAALMGGVPHILASCGGICSCATCHVVIADEWADVIGKANEEESEMLDAVANRRPNSRLGCQVKLANAHNGVRVTVPAES